MEFVLFCGSHMNAYPQDDGKLSLMTETQYEKGIIV
jgi:hypothetical protein